jgi:hypothetical protein
MKRTKSPKFVEDRQPLVEDSDRLDADPFIERLESGEFDMPYRQSHRPHQRWKNDFQRQVYYLTRLGARDCDLAEYFRVTEATIDQWRHTRPGFKEAEMEGKWLFSFKVAETLGQRALGYDYYETEIADHVTRQGEIVKVKKVTHKHMPPDVTAIIFYLKNRHRDMWADVNRTEIDNRITLTAAKKMDFSMFDPKHREFLKEMAVKQISQTSGADE